MNSMLGQWRQVAYWLLQVIVFVRVIRVNFRYACINFIFCIKIVGCKQSGRLSINDILSIRIFILSMWILVWSCRIISIANSDWDLSDMQSLFHWIVLSQHGYVLCVIQWLHWTIFSCWTCFKFNLQALNVAVLSGSSPFCRIWLFWWSSHHRSSCHFVRFQ